MLDAERKDAERKAAERKAAERKAAEQNAAVQKATVREGTITLPTYAITGENRNPVFRSQYGVAHIYPYTLQDEIAGRPEPKTYHTLELENEYLRVTVLPGLGGRVYSVYDKVSQRDVFYKNPVIKFSLLAIRGAFFSGGVEFSFPVAHAPTTADPVNWSMQENEDGSASLTFGGQEHISRLRWMITLTLYPGRCALAQDVQLYNPSVLPGRYHYWTNASLDAGDQTEFIYPLRRVRSYEYAGTASWPVARLDLIQNDPGLPGMEGVPLWPANRLQAPFNFRWQKNMLAQVSIFGRNVDRDFFGAWQHSSDHGYAHVAPARDVAGMKLWSWGNADVGVVNQSALADDGSLYAETQCGAMETQLDFAFLQPGQRRAWREWWLPLRGLGGLTCASAQAGARLSLSITDDEHKALIRVGVCPAKAIENARVVVGIPDKILFEANAAVFPDRPWATSFEVDTRELAGQPVTLRVLNSQGEPVLDYILKREPEPEEPIEPPEIFDLKAAEGLFRLGLKHENLDNREQAKAAYREALALDADHTPAHIRYGLMLLHSAVWQGAEEHLHKASDHCAPEADFYLGVLAAYRGQFEQAERYFLSVLPGTPLYGSALAALGRLALLHEAWEKAAVYCSEAVAHSEYPAGSRLLMALAFRCQNQPEAAIRELHQVLAGDPLNLPALHELALLLPADAGQYRARLERLLADDRQYFLDLACFYLEAGLLEDALDVLESAAQTWEHAPVFYLAGYICHRLGRLEQAARWRGRGAAAGVAFGFPSRLEEVLALEWALEADPGDAITRYLLGNFYYAHERYQEGVTLWRAALAEMPENDVLLRNLGLACWQREGDLEAAVAYFEKALALAPQNYDLYLHLDDCYQALGQSQKREALLRRIQQLDQPREDVRKRKIAIMVDLDHHQQALAILTREQFVPLEMDQSFHDLYVRACLKSAQAKLASGQLDQAIQDYERALGYPPNLGVGRPTGPMQAEIYYHLGCAYEQAGLYRKALDAWQKTANEYHNHGEPLFVFVQKALDKLGRYSELGIEC